jgi:hypothetical protein
MRHFEFTGETITFQGVELRQIRALETFRTGRNEVIFRGDIGGWIEKRENLCDNGWVFSDGIVYGSARILRNALVHGGIVRGHAVVTDFASVWHNATVEGSALMRDHSTAQQNAILRGRAKLLDYACATERALIEGDAILKDGAMAYGMACVGGRAVLEKRARVCGSADVYGDIVFSGDIRYGGARYADIAATATM